VSLVELSTGAASGQLNALSMVHLRAPKQARGIDSRTVRHGEDGGAVDSKLGPIAFRDHSDFDDPQKVMQSCRYFAIKSCFTFGQCSGSLPMDTQLILAANGALTFLASHGAMSQRFCTCRFAVRTASPVRQIHDRWKRYARIR
jgi:hypothetical protein